MLGSDRRSRQDRRRRLRGIWWLASLAMASWPCWQSMAARPKDGVEVLKPGAGPGSLIRLRPATGTSQKLAWEWTAQALTIRGDQAIPRGETKSVHGFLDASVVAVDRDGSSSRRSLKVSNAEPADRALEDGFSETVAKDSRGFTRSIEADGSVGESYGMTSPWTAHRVLDLVFPEEPVGMDAQWKAVRSLELDDGLTIDAEAIFELKQLSDESVGIVFSLDVKRTPAPPKYARQVQVLGDSDPSTRARNRLYISLSCVGRAVQDLAGTLPAEAELRCQAIREWKQGILWSGGATGEQFTVKVGPPSE